MLERFFRPRSLAVVGASATPGALGARPLRILRELGYPGRLYPVNPRHDELAGLRCYPSVAALPEVPDLALVMVNAAAVPASLTQCGAAGVPFAAVVSSGFAEQAAGGGDRRGALRTVLDRYPGMRVAGPNAEGFLTTRGPVPATFSPAVDPERGLDRLLVGSVAVVAQSGGLGFALFDDGQARGLGFSHVVSTGNEDDLGVLDYAAELVTDPDVLVLALFVEGLPDGSAARLAEVAAAARATRTPVVVAKVGRSTAGKRATRSHTAHLAGSDDVYRAVFRREGLVAADDQEELVDLAMAFTRSPLPRGRRVAVLTYSGGAGVWTADALETAGFVLPVLSPALQAAIATLLPPYGSATNPVDVTAQVVRTAGGLTPVLDLLVDSGEVDAVVIATTLTSAQLLGHEEAALGATVRRAGLPVLVYSYTRPSAESVEILRRLDLPWYGSGRRAARALRALAEYAEARPPPALPPPVPAWGRLGEPGPWVEWQAKAALRAAGLPVPAGGPVAGAAAAAAVAQRVGYPVAVKAQAAALEHKTEAGGVVLGVTGPTELADALAAMGDLSPADGWLVERMAPPGVEMIVGLLRDPALGAALLVGLGGVEAEVFADTVCLPVPLTAAEVRDGLGRLRGAALLAGTRGRPAADVGAFAEVVVRVGDLVAAHPEIAELDLNPVRVTPAGAWILDAAGRLA